MCRSKPRENSEPEPMPHDTERWSGREESLSAFASSQFQPWGFLLRQMKRAQPACCRHCLWCWTFQVTGMLLSLLVETHFGELLGHPESKMCFLQCVSFSFLSSWLVSNLFFVSLWEHLAPGGGPFEQFSPSSLRLLSLGGTKGSLCEKYTSEESYPMMTPAWTLQTFEDICKALCKTHAFHMSMRPFSLGRDGKVETPSCTLGTKNHFNTLTTMFSTPPPSAA